MPACLEILVLLVLSLLLLCVMYFPSSPSSALLPMGFIHQKLPWGLVVAVLGLSCVVCQSQAILFSVTSYHCVALARLYPVPQNALGLYMTCICFCCVLSSGLQN